MPSFMRALLIIIVLGITSGGASTPAEKEFQTVDGLVKVAAAPASTVVRYDSAGIPLPVPGSVLDTLSDLTSLSPAPDPDDPLLEIYFLDHASGEELRFPAKLSHLQDFLRSHGSEFTGGSPDARSVAMVRAFSKGLRVHMVEPGTGDSK